MYDLEEMIMSKCLKLKGKWWANHFFYNKEVRELYSHVRKWNKRAVYDWVFDND